MNILFENARIQSYKGFEQRDFFLCGHLASIIIPITHTPRKKWIWRAEFLGAFDSVDIDMLNKGYYLVYYSLNDMYGCPEAIQLMKQFYDFLINELKFDSKTILFGFSRGGLYSLNFAYEYPDLLYGLYLDAPVLDIASWPGGLGTGIGSPLEYMECLRLYGLDQQNVYQYTDNLIYKFQKILSANIPLAIVAGDSDEVVPHNENCQILVDFYNKNNAKILYILKKGCGHHPHSVEDPTQIVDFLVNCL